MTIVYSITAIIVAIALIALLLPRKVAVTRVSIKRPNTYERLPRTCQKSFANSSRYLHRAETRPRHFLPA